MDDELQKEYDRERIRYGNNTSAEQTAYEKLHQPELIRRAASWIPPTRESERERKTYLTKLYKDFNNSDKMDRPI